ncbi:MAG: MFS transporter [Actinomycetota bacterium]|nr:MFS transporter [Actinomycetota bacterium]
MASGLGAEYKKLWTASAISNLGDGVTLVAAPLLAASLTRDPLLIAGAVFVKHLAWLLFSLHAGALIDRLDRRLLMGYVDLFRTALIGFLGMAVLLDLASIPLLYVVFFLIGAAEPLFDNASVAVVPAMVDRRDLQKANGRLTVAQVVMGEFVGPPFGGFLFATVAALPFLFDAGTFAAAAGLVLSLRGRFRAERQQGAAATTLPQEIGEGLRWLAEHRLLLTLALVLGVAGFAVMGVFSILVLYAQEILGLGGIGYGVLMSAFAAGGVAGGFLAERVSGFLGIGRTISVIFLLEAAAFATLALTTNPFLAGVMIALDALAGTVWNVVTISLRQELIPERLLGRVFSSFRLVGFGGMALGALASGLLAREFGLTAPIWVAAALMVVLSATCAVVVNNQAVAEAMEEAQP